MFPLENYPSIKAIHIMKDDKLIFQKFRKDNYDQQLYPTGCIYKSILSVLIGIAIYERRIDSINDCVIDYIPHEEITNIEWYQLRISHVLSKMTGIDWPGPDKPLPSNFEEVMRLSFYAKPGLDFKYKPDPQILIFLLESVYSMDINRILEKKLLSHFHNQDYRWDGRDDSMLVPIQLLDELGELMLHKGMIGDLRIFSESYLEECTKSYAHNVFPEFNSYGLGWWISEYSDVKYYYGAGFGGQKIAVIPSKNVVVSIFSDMDRPHPENNEIIEKIINL